MHLYEFPYEEDKLKIIENNLEILHNNIIKRKNDLSSNHEQ